MGAVMQNLHALHLIKFLDQCDKELTEFGKDILLLKPKGQEKHIKKEYTTETLLVELPKFLEITTATENITNSIDVFFEMHKQHLKTL